MSNPNDQIIEQRNTLLACFQVVNMVVPKWEDTVLGRADEIGLLRINHLMAPIVNRAEFIQDAISKDGKKEPVRIDGRIVDVLGEGEAEIRDGFKAYGMGLYLNEWLDKGGETLVDAVEASAKAYLALVDSTGGQMGTSSESLAIGLIAEIPKKIKMEDGKPNTTLEQAAEIVADQSSFSANPDVKRNLRVFIGSVGDLGNELNAFSQKGKEGNSTGGGEQKS